MKQQFPRDEKLYCPECGQHLALHDDMPGSATGRGCPEPDTDTDSNYDMFDGSYDLPRSVRSVWEYQDNG